MLNIMNGAAAPGALYSGLEGYNNGSQTMAQAGQNLANGAAKENVDVNAAAVNLTAGSLQAEAAAEVISRADSMLGTIIDTFA